MNILLILIPITLILVTVGVLVFNWAVKNGQYDDLEGPAHRILYDDDQDMIPDDAKPPGKRRAETAEKTLRNDDHNGETRDNSDSGN